MDEETDVDDAMWTAISRVNGLLVIISKQQRMLRGMIGAVTILAAIASLEIFALATILGRIGGWGR